MGQSSKSAAKHEYDKPQLKQQIDAAMAEYLQQGHTVERVPSIVVTTLSDIRQIPTPPARQGGGNHRPLAVPAKATDRSKS